MEQLIPFSVWVRMFLSLGGGPSGHVFFFNGGRGGDNLGELAWYAFAYAAAASSNSCTWSGLGLGEDGEYDGDRGGYGIAASQSRMAVTARR